MPIASVDDRVQGMVFGAIACQRCDKRGGQCDKRGGRCDKRGGPCIQPGHAGDHETDCAHTCMHICMHAYKRGNSRDRMNTFASMQAIQAHRAMPANCTPPTWFARCAHAVRRRGWGACLLLPSLAHAEWAAGCCAGIAAEARR